ncbi:17195_t:CDS:2 [Acaulospora morrowiae]|uniref:17195_t:CDS:1 n=1 Tax=Acaulospora morrowiae TaxID=94023 RepID=A0A9N8YY94_9GLOM|nr:17195_t:CDS:2 [Acaulospora morrowiae]
MILNVNISCLKEAPKGPDITEQGEKGISIAEQWLFEPTKDVSQSSVNSDVIDLQTENVSASNISDITPNSSHFVTASGKDTHEQIVSPEDLDDSDEIELTKNQNIELDLIRDLRNNMLIVTPDPIEIPLEDI